MAARGVCRIHPALLPRSARFAPLVEDSPARRNKPSSFRRLAIRKTRRFAVNALNNRCKDIFLSFRSKKNLTRSAQLSKAQGISSEEFDRAVFFFKYFEEIEHADEAESLQHELRRIYQVYHATTLFSRR